MSMWYLIIGLFTVNSIKLDVIPLPTLLHASASGSPSNLTGIIYRIFTSFGYHMQRSLFFLKTISCYLQKYYRVLFCP